jgi:hypothetical protein
MASRRTASGCETTDTRLSSLLPASVSVIAEQTVATDSRPHPMIMVMTVSGWTQVLSVSPPKECLRCTRYVMAVWKAELVQLRLAVTNPSPGQRPVQRLRD